MAASAILPHSLTSVYTVSTPWMWLSQSKPNGRLPTTRKLIKDTPSSASTKRASRVSQTPSKTVMEYLEKAPVPPPPYNFAHQKGASIRFPIFETPETYILPSYTPTIYKLTLVLRKVELLSPYEPSCNRSWKNLIMELNSTQVNFYTLDNMPLLDRAKRSKSKKHFRFSEIEHSYLLNALYKNPQKYLTSNNLVKSYSLQYGKFGIPIDYKKRNYCLRLRLETEQMIVQLPSLDEMINWANYLSTGINVSLDLDVREVPKDRTVPRRRRRRSHRHRSYSDTELIRRELSANSDNYSAFTRRSGNGVKTKISNLFGRNRSNTLPETSSTSFHQSLTHSKTVLDPIIQAQLAIKRNSYHSTPQLTDTLDTSQLRDLRRPSDISTIIEQEGEEDEEMDSEESGGLDDLGDEIPDDEIHSVRQLHGDDSDDESIHHSSSRNQPHFRQTMFTDYPYSNSHGSSNTDSSDDESDIVKWIPDQKVVSKRKFFKDSLRCIKILTTDESWVGKIIVRSSSPPLFTTSNKYARSTSKNKFVKEFVVGPQGLIKAGGD